MRTILFSFLYIVIVYDLITVVDQGLCVKRSAQVQYNYNTTAIKTFFIVLQLYCTCADRLTIGSRKVNILSTECDAKTVVTCKIKHFQKCFRAVYFTRLCRGCKNVVKMFYFTYNHLLCSTCVQHAKTFAKHLQNCLGYMYPPLKHFCKCCANVLRWLHVK